MRITTTIFAACLCVTLVNAWPLDQFGSRALDRLMMSETDSGSELRSKRTIGVLREFFPDISKRIEDKVNKIVGEIFKIFGPAVIGNLLGGQNNNNGSGRKSSEGSTVEVKNPFGDDDDDSFINDDEWFNSPVKQDTGSTKITVDLPKIDADNEVKNSKTTPIETAEITTNQGEEITVADAESATPSVIAA